MTTLQIILLAGIAVLVLAWLWLRGRGGATGRPAPRGGGGDRIDTVTGWPPMPTRVLSVEERATYATLLRALPEYLVLAQVPLSRFIEVPKRNSYADWLRRVGYQCVDFVVCDMSSRVIGVIELQPPNLGERAHKRQARIARTLAAAKIPLHQWRENGTPSVEEVRVALLPAGAAAPAEATQPFGSRPGMPGAARPAATGVATSEAAGMAALAAKSAAAPASDAPRPPPSGNPFEDSARDSRYDERIEPLEPPATWYDDLDSERGTLGKQ